MLVSAVQHHKSFGNIHISHPKDLCKSDFKGKNGGVCWVSAPKNKKKKKRNLQVDLATRTFKNVCRASCLREVEGADRACLPGAHGNVAQMKTVSHFQFNVDFFVRIGIP